MDGMPLINNRLSPLERARRSPSAKSLDADIRDHHDKQDHPLTDAKPDNMTDNLWLKMALSETEVPALPPRSSLRASRVLEGLMIDFPPEKVTPDLDSHPQPVEDDPHASYLSSEEEMSIGADEYDDSLVELDSERAPSRGSSQDGGEYTARMVSFMFVGKPQLVEVPPSASSLKRPSTELSRRSRRRPLPLQLSTSDSRSSTPLSFRSDVLPSSRARSRQQQNPIAPNSTVSRTTSLASRHSFLRSDPFPAATPQEIELSPRPNEIRPKTPTALASAALRGGLRGVSRTLSLSRKKPSVPKLNVDLATVSASLPEEDASPAPSITASVITTLSTVSPATPQEGRDQGPIYYSDIMRNIIKVPPPPSPLTEAKLKTSRFLFGMSKRKMLKAG